MSYLVLARKWRPLTFDQMVGQEFVSRTLKNAVQTGRVAHAFLFTGSRGVGKTSAARILAKCLNCDHGPTAEPCNQCGSCVEITEGRSLEVYEIDGASNTSVDDVRELRDNIRYMPRQGKRRIYIIDEVHMLSKSAFNALLKTLEEPPEHVVFIFATTEPHKVPETIQSRCQRFDFRRIPRPTLLQRLGEMTVKEGIRISDNALGAIAKAADGSMRDAQSLLDQIISFCGTSVQDEMVMEILGVAGPVLFLKVSGSVLQQDPGGCLEALDEIYRQGYDVAQFYRDLVEHFRNLLLVRVLPSPEKVLEMAEAEIQDLKKHVAESSQEDLQRLLNLLLKAEADVLRSSFPRIGLETTLVRMAQTARLQPLSRILEKIEALEAAGLRGRAPGLGAVSGPTAPSRPAGSPPVVAPGPQAPALEKPREPPSSLKPVPGRTTPEPRPPFNRESPSAREVSLPRGAPQPREAPTPPRNPTAAGVVWEGTAQAGSAFLDAVRKERGGLATLLEDVSVWDFSREFITAYCEQGCFLYEKLRQPEAMELLTRIGRECFSSTARFRVRPLGERPGSPPGDAAPDQPPGKQTPGTGKSAAMDEMRGNPAVQDALDLFHGTITEVKPSRDKEKGP